MSTIDLQTRTTTPFGAFALTRKLKPGVFGERYLALHERALTSHTVSLLGGGAVGSAVAEYPEPARFLEVMDRAATLNHPHILKIEHYDVDAAGRPFCVTPYTGDRDGLLTLGLLLRQKGGIMSLAETKRAADQLLGAMAYAHNAGCPHGPLGIDDVLVDRSGSLKLEHYGVVRMLGHPENDLAEQQRREVASAMAIIYQLLTGLRYEEPLIRPGRVIAGLHRSWDDLFATGLTEPGFASGAHALSVLRQCEIEPQSRFLSMARIRAAIQRAMWVG